ncbi:hypothetical protein ACFL2A_01915, partial [Thermodesulfobacteriota bacterium]
SEATEIHSISYFCSTLPQNSKAELQIEDFMGDKVYENKDFFSLSGTQNITCGGTSYTYASYDGSFTVPNSAPGGGSDWDSEPTEDWYYNFETKLEANGVNCTFEYMNTLKILAGAGGGGGPPPANPLNVPASQATATTSSNPPGGGWHGARGGNDQFIIKLINDTGVDIVITGFDLSSTTAQSNLKHVLSKTSAAGWNKNTIWSGSQSLPTGLLNLNSGNADDRTIPANGYIIIDDFHFENNLNPGTFTLSIHFEGGVSSTLTFTLP